MPLTVAVQMDPIERINVASDSTFALMLEAKARGHELLVYTPDKLSMLDGKVSALVQEAQIRDVVGDHVTLGKPVRL
ncbi:MAG: glutathione synthase, partial [Hyphomicrobiales bacterium]|nr:glutathione synthase [Hyphomicrobiales bacterium]